MSHYLQEAAALMMRWFKRLSRAPMSIAFSLVQPVLWLLLFGNLFQKATVMPGFQAPNYITFMVAGVIVMTVLNDTLFGGVELLFDKENGFLERLLATPMSRSTLIVSRFAFVMTVTTMQSLIILGLAALLGVRLATGLPGVAMILVIGMLFGLGLIAISLSLAFTMGGHGDFFSLIGFITLPLIFLSSALAPLQAMPGWMRAIASLNPMTYTIDAVRALILEGWAWGAILRVVVILIVFDAVCLLIGSQVLRRTFA